MPSRLSLCALVALLFGCVGSAHADLSLSCGISFSASVPAGQETCLGEPDLSPPGSSNSTGNSEVALPQFDPAFGQLQSVDVSISISDVEGTAYLDYLGYDPSCNQTPFFIDCASAGVEGSYSASISLGNLLTFTSSGAFIGNGTYYGAIGPGSLGWSSNGSGLPPEPGSGGGNFTGAQVAPFIGTGSLEFLTSGSASDEVYLGIGIGTGATVDQLADLEITVQYNFAPAPEPSFLPVIFLVMSGIVMQRFRHRRA